MELRHLRYAVVLAEEGGFGLAAKRLHISQPALSVQIRNLERLVGAPLFLRLPGGVRLTAVGEAFIPQARATLAAAANALSVARGERALRVGCLRAAWSCWELTDSINTHCEAQYRTFVETLSPAAGVRALASGSIDLLVGYDCDYVPPVWHPSLSRVELLAEPVWIALATSHSLNIPNLTIADLKTELWLVLAGQEDLQRLVIETCRRHGSFEPEIRHVIADEMVSTLRELDAVTLCSPLVRTGNGISTRDPHLPVRRHLYLAWRNEDTEAQRAVTAVTEAVHALYSRHSRYVPTYRRDL